jgi:Fe-S cluster assembly protein SufB
MSEQVTQPDPNQQLAEIKQNYDEKYGFHVPERYVFKAQKGLSREVVAAISEMKGEPQWMRDFRLRSLEIFYRKPMPTWGGDLSGIDFDDIHYYVRPTDRQQRSWDEVPEEIKYTFDRLGIPEAEQKFLAGAGAQFESEVVYHSIRKDLEEKGVIFLDTDSALREHPDLFREYWATVIPPTDNKFAALNSAVWSGGSFIYVPKGVHVEMPLQAYFRINTANMGQFERTLIIVDEGASVHYVEGCLPPGEQVSLGDRWVNIEAIQPGDAVLNGEGCQGVVQSVRARPFKGNLVVIQPLSSANTFRLTPEHPVLAVKRQAVRVKRNMRNLNWKAEVDSALLERTAPQFVPAGELQEGDFLVFPIAKLTRPDPRLTVDVMRLLGYYLAEGSAYIHKTLKQPVVSFSFNEAERENIDEVKALIERVVGKRAMEIAQKGRHSIEVRVYSQPLMDLCLEHCGKGAATKQLSKAVMEQPVERQAHLLETYFKGDGSVYRKRKHLMMRASTASPTLAWQLQELLARQGYYATINVRKGGKDTIQGREITRRDQYILYYSPDKQQSEVRRTQDYFLVPIKRISQQPYEGQVYNFELTHAPNAYVVKGFAVHNCTAPTYSSDSLHSAVVEIIVKRGGRARYTTIQNWSNNVYNLVTKRAIAYQDAVMEWVDCNIGCLAEGSTVTTPEGVKPIEQVNVGDLVLSWDERNQTLCFRKVLAKRFSGYQPVHEVSVGARRLRVTANHPFYSYVYDSEAPKKLGRYRLGYVRADQLKKTLIPLTSLDYGVPYRLKMPSLVTKFESSNQYDDSLVMERQRESRLSVPEYTTDDIMWLFGYWLGDGNLEIEMAQTPDVIRFAKVGFSTPRSDRAQERLVGTLSAIVEAEPTERTDGVHLAWSSKELAEFFILNGFTGKAGEKRVPSWVYSLPQSQRLAFVAGYLDADGTVISRKRRFSWKSSNRALLQDMADVLTTLGIPARLYTEFDQPREVVIMGNRVTAHGAYRLEAPFDSRLLPHVSPALREKVERSAPRTVATKRKIGRSNIALSDQLEVATITRSEASEPVPTWDIEVEGTGNFVSQGFIVHNSKLTMKYPAVYLVEPGAHGEVLSVAFAGKGQHQDAGAKIIHAAPRTTSQIISKSISMHGGRSSYRGLLKVNEGAVGSKSNVVCDALLMDELSRTDTYPSIEIDEKDVTIGHEASVSKVNEEQLFYMMSRGIDEDTANAMIVSGFIEPVAKELPAEYSIELYRLVQLQMEGSVG